MSLSLQEVLVVGSRSDQAKFSELTLDMFRILQTLEREPQEDLAQIFDASPAVGRPPFVSLFLSFDKFYTALIFFHCRKMVEATLF